MFPDHDMAHIIRWMKSKLYGYKPFAVMPNDMGESRLSDTEALLRQSAYASEESFLASDTCRQRSVSPSKESVKSNSEPVKRPFNLQELECDVSVKNCGSNYRGSQRQEFSFTLYDVDGHGKITKDDIAGLVKTIYETLGQSIKVPHYGSKTIKVKLTVSPEKKTACKGGEEMSSSTLTATAKPARDNAAGAAPNAPHRWSNDLNYLKSRERRYRQEQKLRRRHSMSNSGLSEDREADISENDDDEVPLNNKLNNIAMMAPCRSNIYSKYKKRSSSLQRQELLQIIQANMEKNNLCFQTSRHRTNVQQPTRHYVNCWENPTIQLAAENCNNNTFLRSTELKNVDARRIHHQRSRSYDVPTNNNNDRCSMQQPDERRKQPSSHELKHRYRELEQARAKEQVVRWLEQEFATPFKYSNKSKINNLNNFKTTSKEEVKAKNRLCSNDKHEHHHVHEHVHHHYHHYTESPIVV